MSEAIASGALIYALAGLLLLGTALGLQPSPEIECNSG
jgi:hypothetical protein